MINFFFLLIAFHAALVNGADWSVQVGAGGKNVYVPNIFDANVGDTVSI